MAKKNENRLWDGIGEPEFVEENYEEVDIADYDLKNMTLFSSNINVFRQIIRLSDSLKPVERRILYAMYKARALPGHKLKSNMISGLTAVYHCHGDSYPAMVGMAQSWKKQCPLIDGKGNFGNPAYPDMYGAQRYTEACMSQYAKECFFDDYDDDCVEMIFNSASDRDEPMSLPAKFPNILVNGGMGIAFGNAFRIPTYNITDIIEACKKVIEYPESAHIFMIPDLPCGCQIVDDGECFQQIINDGVGVLKMRSDVEIIEGNKNWILKFTSLPWMTSLQSIDEKIVELTKSGVLPIKDKQDHSYATKQKSGKVSMNIDYRLIFDKVHDPYNVLYKLYSMTDLQKSVSIDFKVVMDDLKVRRLNMRDLINSWLDERRGYKRRLFNKKLTKVSARIDLLTVLIRLLTGSNIEKTVKIIRSSNSEEAVSKLMSLCEMTSYQAAKIYEMKLNAFTKDAKAKYEMERSELIKEREKLMKIIGNEKKIDQIIIDELEDLRKYATPRRSKIVSSDTGKRISDTMHSIVITKDNRIKKILFDENNLQKSMNMGSFKTGDYPVKHAVVHNVNSIMLFDSFGRYSVVPVNQIDSTESSHYGYPAYDVAKLSGSIIGFFESYDEDLIKRLEKKYGTPYLVTITKNGYAKKTPMRTYLENARDRGVRAMKIRDDDSVVIASVMFDSSIIIIYTKRGDYAMLRVSEIAEQAKDSMGLITVRVSDGDAVSGICPIGRSDSHVVVLSTKGMMKRISLKYFNGPSKRGSLKDQGSLITLDATDSVIFASGMTAKSKVQIIFRNSIDIFKADDIPEYTKKAKGKKLVSPGPNTNIITGRIVD